MAMLNNQMVYIDGLPTENDEFFFTTSMLVYRRVRKKTTMNLVKDIEGHTGSILDMLKIYWANRANNEDILDDYPQWMRINLLLQ